MSAVIEDVHPYAMSWHCPRCRSSFRDERSFVAEYWYGGSTIFFVWCVACGWRGEIIEEPMISVPEDPQ